MNRNRNSDLLRIHQMRLINSQLFGIGNFGHCDLPFDLAQGGESFDIAQDREPVERLVEPFDICILRFGIFLIIEPDRAKTYRTT